MECNCNWEEKGLVVHVHEKKKIGRPDLDEVLGTIVIVTYTATILFIAYLVASMF